MRPRFSVPVASTETTRKKDKVDGRGSEGDIDEHQVVPAPRIARKNK